MYLKHFTVHLLFYPNVITEKVMQGHFKIDLEYLLSFYYGPTLLPCFGNLITLVLSCEVDFWNCGDLAKKDFYISIMMIIMIQNLYRVYLMCVFIRAVWIDFK